MLRMLYFLLPLLVITWPLQAAEQKQAEGLIAVDFQNKNTVITADKLVLHAKTRKFSYVDSVKVVQEDMTIVCEQLDGNYTENNEIETLTALRNVEIVKGANIKAYGNKAVYKAQSATIDLTENPRVEQDGSTLAADKVIIYVDEDRSEAVGNVTVTMKEKVNPDDTDKPKTKKSKGKKKTAKILP